MFCVFVQWDTAGQETYRSIIPACVRDVQGIIFVYDITSLDSFHSVASWVNFANKNGPTESIKILVGNKSDQESVRTVDPRCGKVRIEKKEEKKCKWTKEKDQDDERM